MHEGDIAFSESMTWESQVYIGSWKVDASWELDREWSGIPGREGGGHGATGRLTNCSLSAGVTVGPSTPWNPIATWPPRAGLPVTIDVRPYGTSKWFRRFTGVVDKSRGGSLGVYTVDVVDRVDRFARPLSIPAIQTYLPHCKTADWTYWKEVGLCHHWFIEKAFRDSGFYSQVPPTSNVALIASLVGSLWADRGELIEGDRYADGTNSMYADYTYRWGYGANDFSARWLTAPRSKYGYGLISLAMMHKYYGSKGYVIQFKFTGGDYLRLEVSGGEPSVTLKVPWGTLGTIPAGKVGPTLFIEFTPGQNNGVNGSSILMSTNRDGVGTTRVECGFTSAADGHIENVFMKAEVDSTPGGMVISYPPEPITESTLTWRPTASLKPFYGAEWGIYASPDVSGLRADSLLDDVTRGLVAHWGIDESGKAVCYGFLETLLWTNSEVFLDDRENTYGEVQWSSDMRNVASAVKVQYRKPSFRSALTPKFTVWQGSSDTLDPKEFDSQIIHPPEDQDWLLVDTNTSVLEKGAACVDAARNSVGNVWAATYESTSPEGQDVAVSAGASMLSVNLRQVDSRSWAVEHRNLSDKKLTLQVEPLAAYVPSSVRGQRAPIIRARAVTQWTPTTILSESYSNDGEVFNLDFGDWASLETNGIADNLSGWLGDGGVILEELAIQPDPRIQVGDAAQVDVTTLDVWVTGFIAGTHESFSQSGYEMGVDVCVGDHGTNARTYDEFEYDNASVTWAGFESKHASDTWLDVQNNPT